MIRGRLYIKYPREGQKQFKINDFRLQNGGKKIAANFTKNKYFMIVKNKYKVQTLCTKKSF